jgi:hypothetical protein
MKRILLLLPALLVLALACKHRPKQPTPVPNTQDSVTHGGYLPVPDFIKSDIMRADSFATGILLRKNRNGKKDSSYIQLPAFHQLASQFLLPELDSASFQQHFTENSLMDETTELLNFIYTSKDPNWPLQKVIVYIRPSLSIDQVDRIYMEKETASGDTLIHQKLTWKCQEYFYTITIKQPNNGPAVTTMEKVIWDPERFAEE